MGKASRSKGAREERALVKYLQSRGYAAERVPLSGAAGGRYTGDVSVPICGVDRTLEVKVRGGTGFSQLYSWLADNYALVVRGDRREPLVVLPLSRALDILDIAERRRTAE